ncbi:glycosyltransferase family 2 protein [Sulfitobacter sp. SK011]|uniref:glycosyltransferase family 2 protein n=1 Tax=Sulfitobacter sp. SK011 TaxID=1389004 RepID=UPI000E0C90F4|nr:glycosyltransferase family 2 protein [Sulfitobacter sp. SK011]AXI43572.1 glycosyl transferase family 2 [Sulfitobacter sp. SK011]
MKICAITMVYRDYWALSQWYAHYSRHLGSDNLFIVAHGHDPKISELCPRASVITVPRDDLSGFDRMRGQLLNSIQDELGGAYDRVIRTDTDELICLDPAHYGSFVELFSKQQSVDALFALGLNIAEVDGEAELGRGDAVMSKRQHAVFTGHYSKAWAVKRGVHLARHGVEVAVDRLSGAKLDIPRGVYLAHLKYANLDALGNVNIDRVKTASGPEKGLPGKAWSDAHKDSRKFYEMIAGLPDRDWDSALEVAFDEIRDNPIRDKEQNVLRAKSVNFPFRITLPDWFRYS